MRNKATALAALSAAQVERIGYALAKQVPAMERGFTIQTLYGDLVIDAGDAPRVVRVVRSMLQKQLARAEGHHG